MDNRRLYKCDNCNCLVEPGKVHVTIRNHWRRGVILRFCSFACLKTAINDKDNKHVAKFEHVVDYPYD